MQSLGDIVLTIPVALSDNPYDVIVGHGARHLLAQTISELHNPPKKVAIITEVNLVDAGWLGGLDSGCEQVVFTIEGGEGGKSLATVEMLCRKLVTAGFSRNDLVVGVGGGIVTDVAGFVAAIYHHQFACTSRRGSWWKDGGKSGRRKEPRWRLLAAKCGVVRYRGAVESAAS